MKYNCGVLRFLICAIRDHQRRNGGRKPISLWIGAASMDDLGYELQYPQSETIESLTVMDVPVHISSAEAPYLRTWDSQMELL